MNLSTYRELQSIRNYSLLCIFGCFLKVIDSISSILKKQKTDYQKLKQLINERRVLFNLKHKNNYSIKSFLIVFDNL